MLDFRHIYKSHQHLCYNCWGAGGGRVLLVQLACWSAGGSHEGLQGDGQSVQRVVCGFKSLLPSLHTHTETHTQQKVWHSGGIPTDRK